MKPLQLLVCLGVFVAVSGTAIIDPSLQQKFLGLGGGGNQSVMVSFTQRIQTVIDQINRLNFSSIADKRTELTNAQMNFSQISQGPLQTFLEGAGVNFQTFWINNRMIIPNANPALVSSISNVPGVARIEPEPVVQLQLPFGEPEDRIEDLGNLTRPGRQSSVAWGVSKIRADSVWRYYTGSGVLVANIDTGVRVSHQFFRDRFRGRYGWFDPYSKSASPSDDNGHGTHTMGTIAGSNGIGVAPGATWMACKGCSGRSCDGNALYSCGQFIQCPTLHDGSGRDCSKAPDVVSNSWGSSGGQSWYDDIINSWQTAGIIPVFSIGNSGPDCSTAGSPGDRDKNIAVGSTDSNERISSFSSLGPSSQGRVKPDIAAPGGQIRSAWHTGDSATNTISGTSMACPHVSGVIALMLERTPTLNYNQIYNAITSKATTNSLDTSTAKTCGGRAPSRYPNNVFGYGRIDAINSVNAV